LQHARLPKECSALSQHGTGCVSLRLTDAVCCEQLFRVRSKAPACSIRRSSKANGCCFQATAMNGVVTLTTGRASYMTAQFFDAACVRGDRSCRIIL
jgi:hypothetical protein